MKIVCPVCKTLLGFQDNRIPGKKVFGKCEKCGSPLVFDPERVKAGAAPTPEDEYSWDAPAFREQTQVVDLNMEPGADFAKPCAVWRRIAAFLLDIALLAGVSAAAYVLLPGWIQEDMMLLVLFAVSAWLYFGLLDGPVGNGRTLGKRLTGVRVQDWEGAPINVGRSFIRFAAFAAPIGLAPFAFPLQGSYTQTSGLIAAGLLGFYFATVYLALFGGPMRRSLHDLVTGAYVVSAGAPGRVDRRPLWPGHTLISCVVVLSFFVCAQLIYTGVLSTWGVTGERLSRTDGGDKAPSRLETKGTQPVAGFAGTSAVRASIPQASRAPFFPQQDPRLDGLVEAAEKGDANLVRQTLENQPDLNVNNMNSQGRFALERAIRNGHLDVVKLLVGKGASIKGDSLGVDAMAAACESGSLEMVKYFLDNGADINPPAGSSIPLISAARSGHTEIAKLLLDRGADVNAKPAGSSYDKSALLAASTAGKLEMIGLLIDAGAVIDATDDNGSTALMRAALNRRYEAVELLLKAGANTSARNKQGDTVFEHAIMGKATPEFLQFLIERGSDPENRDNSGATPLMTAVTSRNQENVEFLLSRNVGLETHDNIGWTALFHAAHTGFIPIIEALVKKGAVVDARDKRGDTVLAWAKTPEVRAILIAHGAPKPEIVTPTTFELSHALPCDQRFVKGLEDAFARYMRFFVSKQRVDKPVQVNVSQLDDSRRKVSFTVEVAGKTEDYELILSGRSGEVRENLKLLENQLKRFAEARKNPHKTHAKKASDDRALNLQVSERISRFDYLDLLGALGFVEQKIVSGEAGVGLFHSAGEAFSLLALFKNTNENRKLSDLLAAQAVSNYLLGCLDERAESNRPFHEGLLLLALGYPAAAEESFDPAGAVEQLLLAFIRYDFDKMKALAANPKVNKRLQGYLLARALETSGRHDVANEQYMKLMTNYPDFLEAKEYVIYNGGVEVSRRYMDSYLEELIEKHLAVVNGFTDTQWVKADRRLEQEVSKGVTEDNRLVKWLKLHNSIVDRDHTITSAGGFISGNLLRGFLMEDIFNALVIWYRLEDIMLGRGAEADKIFEMVKAAYPSKPIIDLLGLKQSKGREAVLAFQRDFQPGNAEGRLLFELLGTGHKHIMTRRQQVHYLKTYRDRESPDARGCFDLYERYKALHYRSVAENLLRNALAADPYNYRFYDEMFKIGLAEEVIESGNRRAGHLYGYLTALAEYRRKNGNTDEAILCYRKAVESCPAQQSAYMELGKIYESREEYDKAIETWSAYLKHDSSSLSAVEIRNCIGKLWLKRGELAKGYDAFLESQKSWQAEALLGFAEASEKTGRILQAEETYRKAAQRYPRGGRCPTELALFYVRQNNYQAASQVLKEYKRFDLQDFYIYWIIENYDKSGQPEKAVDTVRKLQFEPSVDYDKLNWMIARAYMNKGRAKIAADMLSRSFTPMRFRSSWGMELYWDAMLQGGLCTAAELLAKGVAPSKPDDPILEMMARYLLRNGYYDESLKVFIELFRRLDRRVGKEGMELFVPAAVAWSMSGREEGTRKEIVGLLKEVPKDLWAETQVLFLLGEIDEKKLMEFADTEQKQGEAQYCLGFNELRNGRKPEALRYLLMSLENMTGGSGIGNVEETAKRLASL